MKTVIDLGIFAIMVLMMMAVGMDLEPRHFKTSAPQKKTLVLALVAQFILLPMLGLLLIRVISLPPHVSAGILLLTACPNGEVVNYYTWLARANVALAVTMSITSLLLAAITMPVIFEIYALIFGEQFVFAVPPLQLILRLALMVVLPVLAGMAIRHLKPGFPLKHGKSLRNASVLGIAILMVFIFTDQAERVTAEWRQITLASAALILLSMLIGYGMSRVARLSAGDAITVSMAFAARNVALALVVAISLLNRIEFATFATIYYLTEVPLLLSAVVIYRQRSVAMEPANRSDGS